jgi:hypothetical protein
VAEEYGHAVQVSHRLVLGQLDAEFYEREKLGFANVAQLAQQKLHHIHKMPRA